MLFYKFEVFYHAHMVLGAIAFIQSLQPIAREITALMAKAYLPFPQQTAILCHEGTVLAAKQTAGAVCLSESPLVKVVFHR